MKRVMAGLVGATLAMTVASSARSASAAEPRGSLRTRSTDPALPPATMSVQAGEANWRSTMPIASELREARGDARSIALALDLYGKRAGFHIALSGAAGENHGVSAAQAGNSQLTASEVRAALTGVLMGSRGVFVAIGPGLEGRSTSIGLTEAGNESATRWQTVVAGADLRTRVFAGERIYFTGSAFVGAAPVAGGWESTQGPKTVGSGSLSKSLVFAGNVSASLRPTEWIALSAGVAARAADYRFMNGATGRERAVRPYLGIELLY